MLDTKKIEKIVFLDIEAVPQHPSFISMPEKWRELFKSRFKKEFAELDEMHPDAYAYACEELYQSKGGLFAEWGKIVCISYGVLKEEGEGYVLKSVSHAGEDEAAILAAFLKSMDKVLNQPLLNPEWYLCSHAGLLYDYPFMGKRLLYNRMSIPKSLELGEMKPWDIKHIVDTNAVMKWGLYDGVVSLDLLAASLGVESSKTDMDGSKVSEVYWKDKDIERIKKYCVQDIRVLAECVLRMKGVFNKSVTVK